MKNIFSFRQMPNVFTTVSRDCNGGRTGVGIDVNSPSPHSSKRGLGKVSTLILLFALSFGFSSQAWADNHAGTVKCNVQFYAARSEGNIDQWWGGNDGLALSNQSNWDLGVITDFYLKGAYATYWRETSGTRGNICTDDAYFHYCVFFNNDGASSSTWNDINTKYAKYDQNNVTMQYNENATFDSEKHISADLKKNGQYTLIFNFSTKGNYNGESNCPDELLINNGNQNYAIIFTYYPNTAVTFGAGTGMSQQGTISCHKDGETSTKYTSGQEITKGTSIIFSATPKAGYELAGWYSDAACTNSLQNGANDYVMTTAGESQSVYAKFVAQHVVTLVGFDKAFAYAGNVAGSANMVIPVGRTYTNYSTEGGVNNVSVNGNTFTFKATADGTLTANFGYKEPKIQVDETASYIIGGAAIKLNPKYTDVAADATYEWSGDDKVTFSATDVPNPNISAEISEEDVNEDDYTITVTVTQGGISDIKNITLHVTKAADKCATCFPYEAQ